MSRGSWGSWARAFILGTASWQYLHLGLNNSSRYSPCIKSASTPLSVRPESRTPLLRSDCSVRSSSGKNRTLPITSPAKNTPHTIRVATGQTGAPPAPHQLGRPAAGASFALRRIPHHAKSSTASMMLSSTAASPGLRSIRVPKQPQSIEAPICQALAISAVKYAVNKAAAGRVILGCQLHTSARPRANSIGPKSAVALAAVVVSSQLSCGNPRMCM